MRLLRTVAPLVLVAALAAACGNDSSSGPGTSTGAAISTTVQLRPVSARYAQNTAQGQEQLGPQTPKQLVSTLKKYDCTSPPTVLQGKLLMCDASRNVYLLDAPMISGGISSAVPLQIGNSKNWYVKVTFDPKAAATLSKAADTMVGSELAIVLKGKVLTALVVDSSMKDGHIGITGDYTKATATQLAQDLSA